MTRDEILKLHELSEEEQIKWLKKKDVLKPLDCDKCKLPIFHECDCGFCHEFAYESLADCAFRLRDESDFVEWLKQLRVILGDSGRLVTAWVVLLRAEPIHWIQSALLARLENEKD